MSESELVKSRLAYLAEIRINFKEMETLDKAYEVVIAERVKAMSPREESEVDTTKEPALPKDFTAVEAIHALNVAQIALITNFNKAPFDSDQMAEIEKLLQSITEILFAEVAETVNS